MTSDDHDETIIEPDGEAATNSTNMTSIIKSTIRYITIYILSILGICYGYLVLHMSAQLWLIPFYHFCKVIRHPLSEEDALVACNILVIGQIGLFITLLRPHMLDVDTCGVLAALVCAMICLLAVAGVIGQILAVLAG